ncbi:hypothetical protein BDW69DRAFT_183494 [Aspergillus filifer]
MAGSHGLPPTSASLLQLVAKIAQLSYKCARLVKNGPRAQRKYLQAIPHLFKHLLSFEQGAEDANEDHSSPLEPPSLNEKSVSECYDGLSSLYTDLQERMKELPVIYPLHEKEWKVYLERASNCRSLLAARSHSGHNMSNMLSIRRRPSPYPGKGDWCLEKDAVQRWFEGSTGLLWCYGPPGVGKSFLASHLVDHLQHSKRSAIYHFCDCASRGKESAIHVLQDLLLQLIEQGSYKVLTILDESCADPSKLQNPAEVIELIAKVGLASPVYFVVDGLDQFPNSVEFLPYVTALVSSDVNVLITSRNVPHIRKSITLAAQPEVVSSQNDIQRNAVTKFENNYLATDKAVSTGNELLLSRPSSQASLHVAASEGLGDLTSKLLIDGGSADDLGSNVAVEP